ncbi:hypothetical protein C2G38_2159987 [Gigaspora rosea]|uniref:TLDc domain-containing protein n=1 Tax=Gigaspora rosea TaxID=44941 RepID=A0A397VYT9_9GLOM|nr:hypothetical protein C2G38_2159987 [Gigaspora rosea]
MSQMDTILFQHFSNDFAQLLESEYNYDVVIKLDEQSFKLHSLIYLHWYNFIKFPLKDIDSSTIFDLLISFHELDFEELVIYIQLYLINDKALWLRFKFFKVYYTCFLYDDFEALQTFYIDIFAEYPSLIFDANEFNLVDESDLVTLLKRDDLQLEESKIWDKMIQWGKENTQDLPFNITQWTNENFLALKTTLNNCISLIQYFQMFGKDLVTKVKPYKQILDPNLWDDITTKIMAPNESVSSIILPARKIFFNFINHSSIINEEHFAEISSWIDRNSSTYDIRCIPYEFKLLLRGSKDGFEFESFDTLCADIPGTVIVMKVNKMNELLGGYNPLVWSSDSDECRIKNADIAIGYDSSANNYGPYFSNSFLMWGNKKWYYNTYENDHEKLLRDEEEDGNGFFVDEIEVFQVLKNQMKYKTLSN